QVVHAGAHPAPATRRARAPLKADAGGPDARPGGRIAGAPDTTRMTVMRVRQQFAAGGLDATPRRKRPTGRQYRKPDGSREARLVALACSAAPGGRARWTMKLLADRLVELEVVESIDPAAAWRALKKT